MADQAVREVIIIGSGPAGDTAALYAARAEMKPLVILGFPPGGQLTMTTDVENYPGFPDGIMGPDIMELFKKQAERFGAEYISGQVSSVDFSKRPFKLTVDESEDHYAKAVIIATGATAKFLGLESEEKLKGRGVSACATCDGFFFKDEELIVVGGGDTAMEEALFLTKFASKVHVMHRRDELRASKIMQDRAFANPKIDFIWNSTIDEVLGVEEGQVKGVKLRNLVSNEVTEMPVGGLFIAIGHKPNTELFEGVLDMNETGYVITHDGTKTNVPGVFASGDAQDWTYRQAVTAAGTGCMAAIDAERFLAEDEATAPQGAEAARTA